MSNKPIVIQVTSTFSHIKNTPILIALCDDGTMWYASPTDLINGEGQWEELPDIPDVGRSR